MKLNFVHNATQRLATQRSVPTPQLEAVIEYGAPAKRAQAVKKVIQAAPQLTQHKETFQLVMTLLNSVDSTKRCELLYSLRKKLKDMCRNRFGNIVLQRLVEVLPATQVREIAEDLREDAADLARHPFGNRVIQKLAAHAESGDIIAAALHDDIAILALHGTAQHAIAALISNTAGNLIDACDGGLMASMVAMEESAVLTALAKSPRVPEEKQQQAHALLLTNIATLITEGRQHFAIVATLETVSAEQLGAWQKAITPEVKSMADKKSMCAVVAALIRRMTGKAREQVVVSALQAFESVQEAACHPYGSMVVREALSAGNVALPKKQLAQLEAEIGTLATHVTGVVVVQRMIMLHDSCSSNVVAAIQARLGELVTHAAGTHAVQAALDHADDKEAVQDMAAALLSGAAELCRDQHGTFAVQKALAVASAETVALVCSDMETRVRDLAFDPKANFTVAATLVTAKRLGLKDSVKQLMDQLKPEVTRLATKPWVGKVVLDAMFQVASAALKDAIRDVIFLKCELYLSHVPEASQDNNRRRTRSASGGPEKRHFKERSE